MEFHSQKRYLRVPELYKIVDELLISTADNKVDFII
jgi:hypothetical protein